MPPMILAAFGVGPMELIILGILGMLFLAPVIAVIAVLAHKAKGQSPPLPPSAPTNALLPCLDCGHQVSRQAQTCPYCGRPLATRG